MVIFQENVSFDHYFGTYPNAANTDGQPFHATPGTPSVNGLTPALLTDNPNAEPADAAHPHQALTCDQDHDYTPEQQAMDGGLMDKFVQFTEVTSCSPPQLTAPGLVMDYYDGNTVTALWNYAQHFAMSDNFYRHRVRPVHPGCAQPDLRADLRRDRADRPAGSPSDPGVIGSPNTAGNGTVYGDADPYYDDCSNHTGPTIKMTGQNVGNLLNATRASPGAGSRAASRRPTRTATARRSAARTHNNIGGVTVTDYSAHHEPFQYYASTANPNHLPPANLAEVGHNGQANHQYDLSWFYKDLAHGHMPAVSFLKAANYQDGHAGYSDPLDEQHFLVKTINAIMQSKFWKNTAIVITYDDSDGWYDHVDAAHRQLLRRPGDRRAERHRRLRQRHPAGRLRGPLRLRPAAAVPGHLALREDQLREQLDLDRPDLDPRLRREQLAGRSADGHGSFDALAGSLGDMFTFSTPSRDAVPQREDGRRHRTDLTPSRASGAGPPRFPCARGLPPGSGVLPRASTPGPPHA